MQTYVASIQNIKNIIAFDRFISLKKVLFLFALRRSTCNDRNRFIYGVVCFIPKRKGFSCEQIPKLSFMYVNVTHFFCCC